MGLYSQRSTICFTGVLEGEKKEGKPENTQRNNGWKLPKFGQRHKHTDSRSWANPRWDEPKEFYIKSNYNQTSKN